MELNNQNKIIVMKFGGTTSGSCTTEQRIRDARLLIETYLKQDYYVIPVFSAMRRPSEGIAITDTLLKYRQILGNPAYSLTENAHYFYNLLFHPHLGLMFDLGLIPQTVYHAVLGSGDIEPETLANHPVLDEVWRRVRKVVETAVAYFHAPASPAQLDSIAVHGERLAATVITHYLNQQWQESLLFVAETATAKELGIMTNGNFTNADILQGEIYESSVRKKIERYQQQNIIPVVTGFDGIYKNSTISSEEAITTLGRGGSDLTATYLAKVLRAESVFLLKDTDGVLTTNPKIVSDAYRLSELPYELAVVAGNIQDRAIAPAMQGKIPIEVFNPKNPHLRTYIGSSSIEEKAYLIPNPVRVRCLMVRIFNGMQPVQFIANLLYEIQTEVNLQLVTLESDVNQILLMVKECPEAQQLAEKISTQIDVVVHSVEAHYVQIVGRLDETHYQLLQQIIGTHHPVLTPVYKPSFNKFTALIPITSDVNLLIQQIHERLFLAERSVTWSHHIDIQTMNNHHSLREPLAS